MDFVSVDDGAGQVLKYRLYVYETRIIQEIKFKIEAMAEGGKRLETSDLILNVTCPGFVSVQSPKSDIHGISPMSANVNLYVGGQGSYS